MNPFLLGGIVVFILTMVVAAIAQRLNPHHDECIVCFFIIISTPFLLYMLYAYYTHFYAGVVGMFFMLLITFFGSLLILHDIYNHRWG